MSGMFSNAQQANDSPTWFVNLRLWQRPTSLFAEDSVTLFLEQANSLKLDQPYRQRLLRLSEADGELYGQYYQFKDFSRWRGSGTSPALLEALTLDAIDDLPGCRVAIRSSQLEGQAGYRAERMPGGKCEFEYDGKLRQVLVGFEVSQSGHRLKTYDKGIDPETGKGLWGALMGPYEFVKL